MNTLCQPAACANGCPSAKMAAQLPDKMRTNKAGYSSLIALFAPGVLFVLGLCYLPGSNSTVSLLFSPRDWPWQLWVIAVSGVAATTAGFGDWAYHRWVMKCVIPKKERNCELLALVGGGVPMFFLMSAASFSEHPQQFLIPVLVTLIFTVVLICYDEFIFHRRRCRRFETILHRFLVFGNGTAWIAWAHWCFVKGGFNG